MATVKALTVNQAAELLGVSISKVYADIRKGIITGHKGANRKFILDIEDIIVKPVITYTQTQERGYNPRQRRWGACSLTNCKHIFGFHYKAVYGNINPQDLEIIEHNLEDPQDIPNAFNKNLVIAILREENKELTQQNKQILENHKIALENSRDLQNIIAENQTQLLRIITEGFQILTEARAPNP